MSIINAVIKKILDALGIDSTGNLEVLLQESIGPQERGIEEPIARVALSPQITFSPRCLESEHVKSLLSNLGLWDEMQQEGLNDSLIAVSYEASGYELPLDTRRHFYNDPLIIISYEASGYELPLDTRRHFYSAQ